jgi:Subtilase family
MSDLPHLRLEGEPTSSSYSYAGGTPQGVRFDLPARNQPAHARDVRTALETADAEAKRRLEEEEAAHPQLVEWNPEGIVLTFQSEPNHPISLEGLERRGGIHLLGMTEQGGTQTARVFVPEKKLTAFLRLVDAYASSIVLTYLAEPANVAELRALQNEDDGIRFWGPVYKTREGKRKLRFVVPEPSVPAFTGFADELGTLVLSSRKNQKLIDSVTTIRLAITEDFWQDTLPYPPLDGELWWEIWLRASRQDANEIFHRFLDVAATIGIDRVSDRYVSFPERLVLHAYASARQISSSMRLITMVAELRKAKELATPYVTIPARNQRDLVDDAHRRIVPPARNAPSVCILDAGVNQPHPLLSPALAPEDVQAVEADWGTADHHPEQHGTGMAGNALYGCLTELMTTTVAVTLRHRLESVKFLPPPPRYNEPPVYGRVMQDAVALAQIQSPRRNRVICMAVTADDREMGMPTTWSAAVDDMCAGVLDEIPKLMFISAGNVLPEHFFSPEYEYHRWNTTKAGIDDPGQSWNALTVGAYTEKVFIEDRTFDGWQPIAESGDLTPTSRTSLPWPDKNRKGWPIKPDIVMEGGNYVERGNERSDLDDLSLLTTILDRSGRLLEVTRDTSPATALGSRFAAIIWSRYPRFRPETIRGLMIHSASWTAAMRRRYPGDSKSVAQNCLRCYGYGVPDLGKALSSAENAATLIYEGDIQPFRKDGSSCKTNKMHLHQLPWPTEVLEDLGPTQVSMRVTLSYFIEPGPNNIGWGVNHRYASHGLRFDVIRPLEGVNAFKRRLSKTEWDAPNARPQNVEETREWVIGDQGRTHGSLHSDWWVGKAADLARCNQIAIYPVTGWWKERQHLGRHDRKARYSLIVTIETPETDIYTPISQDVSVQTEITT